MGFGGISVWQLLIVLVIVVLIFGTKKLRGMGGDLGSAIKNFKSAVNDPSADESNGGTANEQLSQSAKSDETIDVKVENKTDA